jgi:transcriptional regulator with XRE-family HTH domain
MAREYADKVHAKIIKALTEARKSSGLSHEALAKKTGISRPAISFIESGKRKPTLYSCIRLAEALDIKLGNILIDSE